MKRHFNTSAVIFYLLTTLMAIVSVVSFIKAASWVNKPFAGFLMYEFPYVGSMGDRGWPGTQAGLRLMDKIVGANGKAITTGNEIQALAADLPLGSPVHYEVESKDKVRMVEVRTTAFTLKDFLLVFFVPFIGGFALYLLGVIVYILKPNIRSSWVFYILCFTLGTYMVTGFEIQSSYFFVHLHWVIVPLFPATFVHLGLIFPDRKQFLKHFRFPEYLIYIPAMLLIVAYQIRLFTLGGVASSYSPLILNYKQIAVVTRWFTFFGVGSIVALILYSAYKASSIIARQRARMILFGVTIAFLPSVIIVLLAFFLRFNFPINFLVLFVIFFPASIAYSIVRHNLFDADVIIKRTVGYFVVTAVVVSAYALVSIGFNVFLDKYQVAQSRLFPIFFTIMVILVFNPLRNRVQALVDRIFFRKEYDYGVIIDKIGSAITSLIDLGQILKRLTQTFINDMFINTTSVMLLNPEGTAYRVYLADGENHQEVEKVEFKRSEPIVEIIEGEKSELTKNDVLEDPKFRKISKQCKMNFDTLKASLIVPLVFQDKVIGMMNLGEKKSGKAFNRDDIDLLHALAKQGAVAIENARMVDEIIEKERMRTKIMDAFGKYVTPEVRDQILEGNIPLDGEAMEVTVLFADLRDFTTLAESTTPKEVVRIINGYFSEMADAIGQNHGLVLQFIGDEIEAVFGAPMPLEDHPTHAFRAALAMQERLVAVNEKLEQQGYGPLRHGIGIHTGTVVAANIGSEDRLSYAMVGDTVNLASRIQSLNKEFGTDLLISATTVEKLVDDIAIEKLPATTVKGKRNPVEVYKLVQTP